MSWILNDLLFVIILFIYFIYYFIYIYFIYIIYFIYYLFQSTVVSKASIRQLLSIGRWERLRQYRLSL